MWLLRLCLATHFYCSQRMQGPLKEQAHLPKQALRDLPNTTQSIDGEVEKMGRTLSGNPYNSFHFYSCRCQEKNIWHLSLGYSGLQVGALLRIQPKPASKIVHLKRSWIWDNSCVATLITDNIPHPIYDMCTSPHLASVVLLYKLAWRVTLFKGNSSF